ncbi:hypothetical protein GCM10023194_07910 [Planotetraspora phitsanulokensis]|uniref:Uncharacterized protein n=1 Tax=Planotetraspora phitsanulokensis TaxID=575192 RepID=A0A8J3XKW6_9ACTN|nr:hypothetical protein [Planotetraspora phitsanulokensis]GII40023.1 hypothetical protein Pph01_50260 [Planotetraspora phitsanulokensis]
MRDDGSSATPSAGVPAGLTRTRQALHGVAELIMAGPQYRTSGTIRLRVVAGGFATVSTPDLRVDGDSLITETGDMLPLHGVTYASLAEAAGVEAGAPEGLYQDGSGADPGQSVNVEADAAAYLTHCLARGDTELRRLASAAGQEMAPVLWPEHFDLAITLDEVNYGVSLGDSAIDEPYAYVGPWRPREGDFWNMPFGAARPLGDLAETGALAAFLEEGRRRTGDAG